MQYENDDLKLKIAKEEQQVKEGQKRLEKEYTEKVAALTNLNMQDREKHQCKASELESTIKKLQIELDGEKKVRS